MTELQKQLNNEIERGYVKSQRHPKYPLTIYNYTHRAQYEKEWNDTIRTARGLVLDDGGNIIANPFPKFFNLGEHKEELPDEVFQVYHKYDGSLGIIFWYDKKWNICTRGSFTSDQAIEAQIMLDQLSISKDLREWTHLVEIIYPGNRIVVDYGASYELIYLGSRFNATGQEHNFIDIPMEHAKTDLSGLSIANLSSLEVDNAEGFVVHWPKSGLRLKVKFDEYVRLHRLVTGINAKSVWELLRTNKGIDELLDHVPDEFYQWVRETSQKIIRDFEGIQAKAYRAKSEIENLETRKEQAMYLKEHFDQSIMGLAFSMLDNKDYTDTIWRHVKPKADKPFREEI